jgi:hypothetical protein
MKKILINNEEVMQIGSDDKRVLSMAGMPVVTDWPNVSNDVLLGRSINARSNLTKHTDEYLDNAVSLTDIDRVTKKLDLLGAKLSAKTPVKLVVL